MLPKQVASLYQTSKNSAAECIENVTICNSDVMDFTEISMGSSPMEVYYKVDHILGNQNTILFFRRSYSWTHFTRCSKQESTNIKYSRYNPSMTASWLLLEFQAKLTRRWVICMDRKLQPWLLICWVVRPCLSSLTGPKTDYFCEWPSTLEALLPESNPSAIHSPNIDFSAKPWNWQQGWTHLVKVVTINKVQVDRL